MIKTQWNTSLYDPTPKACNPQGAHFRRGEIYAAVYCCVLAGVESAREICKIVDRVDQRVYDTLTTLEQFGYVTHTINVKGRGHAKIWKATQ